MDCSIRTKGLDWSRSQVDRLASAGSTWAMRCLWSTAVIQDHLRGAQSALAAEAEFVQDTKFMGARKHRVEFGCIENAQQFHVVPATPELLASGPIPTTPPSW